MRWTHIVLLRLRSLFHKNRAETDLDDELRFHLERQMEQNIARGMPPEEARYAALRGFGGVAQVQEDCRQARGIGYIESAARDVQFGLRVLCRSPGYAGVAVGLLALGITASSTIFSVFYGVLLRPPPYPEADGLVTIRWSDTRGGARGFSFTDYEELRRQSASFENLAAVAGTGGFVVTGGSEPEYVLGQYVSDNYFAALGLSPLVGGMVATDNGGRNNAPAVLLAHAFWQRRFGGNPQVVGQNLTIDDLPHRIAGVMSPDGYLGPSDIWMLGFADAPPTWADHVGITGRLGPGVSLAQAQAELRLIEERLGPGGGAGEESRTLQVRSLEESWYPDYYREPLLLLLGAGVLVLLVACANVAHLMLTRTASRVQEISVRTALGAGRLQLMRQWFTESLLLGVLAAVAGVVGAVWSTQFVVSLIPDNALRFGIRGGADAIRVDGPVLFFAVAVAVFTVLVCGSAPALFALRTNIATGLKTGAKSFAAARTRWHSSRQFFAVSQVALSLMLLIGAGLLLQTYVRFASEHRGYDPDNILRMGDCNLSEAKYPEASQRMSFVRQALEKVSAVPGVSSTAVQSQLSRRHGREFAIEGQPAPELNEALQAVHFVVSPGYFDLMRIPLHAGRDFTPTDAAGSEPVCIINRTMAQRYWPDENPVGQRIRRLRPLGDQQQPRSFLIVGVAGDVKQALDPRYPLRIDPQASIYLPYEQNAHPNLSFLVRAESDPAQLADGLREAVWLLDPDLPFFAVKTQRQALAERHEPARFNLILVGLLAGLAVILAGTGLYAVLAYTVSQRTNEVGIRMALGARSRDIAALILSQGLRLVAAGLLVGLAGSLALRRVIASQLFGIAPTDAATWASGCGFVVVVSLAACWLPARRAARVDPMTALRRE